MNYIHYVILIVLESYPDAMIFDNWLVKPVIMQTVVYYPDGTISQYCYIVKEGGYEKQNGFH